VVLRICARQTGLSLGRADVLGLAEAREERRRAERDSANHWRGERGYVLLPSLRDVVFTDHVKPLILLSINTGCRRGELFDLTWENADLDRRLLTVTGATAKSRRTRHIPLNREATSVLLNWRAQCLETAGLVFVNEAGERFDRASTSWRRLLQNAQNVPCTPKLSSLRPVIAASPSRLRM
jgi:integrase